MKASAGMQVKWLILGGGLTGLSTAYHLEQLRATDYLLVEKNPFFGGLCASERRGNFTFDMSGHLLHLKTPYATALVRRLLRGNLLKHKRRAFIDFAGTRVPFPFQANLWALPQSVRQACVQGAQQVSPHQTVKPTNFEQWCLQTFGAGIYRHFLKPYNTKLWQISPRRLTCDWCGPFVPRPYLKQILEGANHPTRTTYGYNHCFYYPKRGGCGALAEALATHIPNTWLQATVQRIDLKKRYAVINGRTVFFEKLINTLPLPVCIQLCAPVPADISRAAKTLKYTTVHVLQLAVKYTGKPFHWIYFPQPDVPFFRIGMQSAFSPENAPEGTASFYVETTQKITDFPRTQRAIFKALVQKGIIEKQDHILDSFWRTISPAYVVYDGNRFAAQKHLLNWLNKQGCLSAGRYGLWEYSFMERSIIQGKQIACRLTQNKK